MEFHMNPSCALYIERINNFKIAVPNLRLQLMHYPQDVGFAEILRNFLSVTADVS